MTDIHPQDAFDYEPPEVTCLDCGQPFIQTWLLVVMCADCVDRQLRAAKESLPNPKETIFVAGY